jgi:uncharacterized membrane protein
VGLFSIFKKKEAFFSEEENDRIIAAIRESENRTSGEIRLFVESRNVYMDPLERAAEIFVQLKMDQTLHHNGVILYVAVKDREVALFGDKGIHEKVGTLYWNAEVNEMIQYFKENKLVDGVINCIHHIGNTLCEKFPYNPSEDKNELPDEIVFGK